MSMTNYLETALLELLLNGTAIANIADNAASAPLTEFYVSLHTDDPGEDGDQETDEVSYTGYTRAAVARTNVGWTITSNSASPTENIEFPVGTGGGGTVTHVGIGTAATGAGVLLFKGAVTPGIVTGAGYVPRLTTDSVITIE
jgi:hypothetical protein